MHGCLRAYREFFLAPVFCVICAVDVAHAESTAAALLQKIALEIHTARALPQGAGTQFVCPENPGLLEGIDKKTLWNVLGRPDTMDPPASERSRTIAVWTYFLTNPHLPGQRGGFPELSFIIDRNGHVDAVSCQYAY